MVESAIVLRVESVTEWAAQSTLASVTILGPTSETLRDDDARPYFVWWVDCTIGELKAHLADPDVEQRAYWLGVVLREANTRDVWLFTHPAEIRALWPKLVRYLGRTRSMWAWLLGMPAPEWPPSEASR